MEDNTLHQPDVNQEPTQNSGSDELKLCKAELSTYQDKYTRLQADFDNFKRRTDKEKISWISSAQSAVLVDLLSIVDDFDRAMSEAKKASVDNAAIASWIRGFELIDKSFYKLLNKYGVQEMKDYATFDPEKHEALMHVDSADHKTGEIVQVLQKGFMVKDTVLRPAKVSVAK